MIGEIVVRYSTSQSTMVNAQSRWNCGWAWGVIITIVVTYFAFVALDVHYFYSTYFTVNALVICGSLYLTMNTEPGHVSHLGESIAAKYAWFCFSQYFVNIFVRDALVAKMLNAEEEFAVDPRKFSEVSICPTCLVDKSLASIHCAVGVLVLFVEMADCLSQKCNLCVVNLDHHCPFVCNCVGERNRLLFVWFTGSASVGCAYFALLSLYLQYHLYCPEAKGMVRVLLVVVI